MPLVVSPVKTNVSPTKPLAIMTSLKTSVKILKYFFNCNSLPSVTSSRKDNLGLGTHSEICK